MERKILFLAIALFLVLNFSFLSAEEFGYNLLKEDSIINVTNITNFINQTDYVNFWITDIGTLGTVNATQFNNNDGTLTIDIAWINANWCQISGCTMEGNIDMGGNNITNADVISANTFIGDGSQLTGVSTEGLNNTLYIYFHTSMKSSVIYNLSESDLVNVNITPEPGSHYVFGGEL